MQSTSLLWRGGAGRLRFIGLLGIVETGALHAPPGGMEPGLGREMTFEEWIRISLVVKVRTFQGEGSKSTNGQPGQKKNNNNPTYFQLCLPQGWAQAEKWWETISLSCHQNHECFNTPKLSLTCHRADTVAIRRITPYLPHSCLQWRSYHDSCLSFQVYISLSQVLGTRSWSWTSHLICHSDSSSEYLSQAL